MSVKITDNTARFISKHDNLVDVVLNTMASDIERLAKLVVPFKKGQLRSSITHFRRGLMKYSVIANKEYAAYQEFGGDGSRIVQNYSKPGTGKGYLSLTGKKIGGDMGRRLEAAKRLLF